MSTGVERLRKHDSTKLERESVVCRGNGRSFVFSCFRDRLRPEAPHRAAIGRGRLADELAKAGVEPGGGAKAARGSDVVQPGVARRKEALGVAYPVTQQVLVNRHATILAKQPHGRRRLHLDRLGDVFHRERFAKVRGNQRRHPFEPAQRAGGIG